MFPVCKVKLFKIELELSSSRISFKAKLNVMLDAKVGVETEIDVVLLGTTTTGWFAVK